MPSLKGKTVLIIGRGSGIARAIAPGTIDTGAYDSLGDCHRSARPHHRPD